MTRQKFLQVWQVATGMIISFISAPAIYFWLTDRSGSTEIDDRWIDAGSIEDLPIDQWRKEMLFFQRQDRWASFERKELIYIYRSEQDIIVFSAICPHAACLIRKNDEGFGCPCHKSSFTSDGIVLSGPSPRSLDRLDTKVEDGRLYVKYEKFRSGTNVKKVIG
jgi:Rieske Fe-S protein